MNSKLSNKRSRHSSTNGLGTTRRAVLAAGGTVALTGLAGCSSLDGLLARAGEQVVGTTVSAPAAFYLGRPSSSESTSTNSGQDGSDEPQVFRAGPGEVRRIPATARVESREIELEGWSIVSATTAQDYNSSRSNKPTEWWAGPDGNGDDEDDSDILVAILNIELDLLAYIAVAQDAVERREQAEAKRALDAFIDATTEELRPKLDKCGTGLCETVREHSDHRTKAVRQGNDAIEAENWEEADELLQDVEEIVLGDIERLDDELVRRRPGRPRFSDIIRYLRDEPTIGEHFTICLPDASLPGDRGSLAEVLTPQFIHSNGLIDEVREDDKVEYESGQDDDDNCGDPDPSGAVTLHRDLTCGNILSADLDTYRTENRGIVGYSTEGGAVVSGAPASADIDGKCVFVAPDGTLREPENLDSWGRQRTAGDVSVSETLVCPVTVIPEDFPCPLPGLFYVRRCIHDDQIIFAGGWVLDEGALYEHSATLLFDEGPTEIASLTPEDAQSENLDDRIVEQFSRSRSEHGSAVIVGDIDDDGDDVPAALQSEEGRRGLNAVNVKVAGERGDNSDPITILHKKRLALDAPLVHLAGAGELSTEEKRDYIVPVAMDKGLR